jgi:hypothetical protein
VKEIDVKQLEEESSGLIQNIRNNYGLSSGLLNKIDDYSSSSKYRSITLSMSILLVLKDYFRIRSFTSLIKKELKSAGVPVVKRREILRKIRQQLLLTRRIGQLRTMQKLFKYWHIVHLPFAITMFVIMFVHIIVTITFGYRWIF